MGINLSVEQFRQEISKYKDYLLISSSPLESIRLFSRFQKIIVSINGSPYVVLKSDTTEASLNHISAIKKIDNGSMCTYIFKCKNYADMNHTSINEFRLECM